MSAYVPAIGDIVRSGPGMTRFTVLECGEWIKLAYPHGLGVIYRKADALTLVQAAPVAVVKPTAPQTIQALPKYMVPGDVLWRNGARLTIQMVIGNDGRHVTVWTIDTAGMCSAQRLDVMGSHTLCGGPTWADYTANGVPDLGKIIKQVIAKQGRRIA